MSFIARLGWMTAFPKKKSTNHFTSLPGLPGSAFVVAGYQVLPGDAPTKAHPLPPLVESRNTGDEQNDEIFSPGAQSTASDLSADGRCEDVRS